MSENAFTLEDLDREIERKYAPVQFRANDEDFVLVSLLRVDKKVRKEVMERLEGLDKSDNEEDEFDEDKTVAELEFILSAVTRDKKGAKLVRALNHDMLRLMTLMKKWQEATQPGEAQGSPN